MQQMLCTVNICVPESILCVAVSDVIAGWVLGPKLQVCLAWDNLAIREWQGLHDISPPPSPPPPPPAA